jgi:hypothetical protein
MPGRKRQWAIAMATAAPPLDSGLGVNARPKGRTRFYFHLSLACLAVAVIGFAPTYWMQVPMGTFNGQPLLHIHGLAFTGWLFLLVGQNWRIAQGRLDNHRAWGLAGIALATLIFVLGVTTAIVGLQERYEHGYAEAGRTFVIVPLVTISLFYGFFIAAIANLRRPEWHRRFIFVATSAMLVPALARLFQLARFGFAPGMRPGMRQPSLVSASLMPIMISLLIIGAGMLHDWRTRRKVHPAWIIGLIVIIPIALLRGPVSQTAAWQAFADWTTRIA